MKNIVRSLLVLVASVCCLFFIRGVCMLPLTYSEPQDGIDCKLNAYLAQYKLESENKLNTVPGIGTLNVDKQLLSYAFDEISLSAEAYKRAFSSYLFISNQAAGWRILDNCSASKRRFNNKIATIIGDLHSKFDVPRFTFGDIKDESIRNFYVEQFQKLDDDITQYLWGKSYDQKDFAHDFLVFLDECLEKYRLSFEEYFKQKKLEQAKYQEIMNFFERSLYDRRVMAIETAEKKPIKSANYVYDSFLTD